MDELELRDQFNEQEVMMFQDPTMLDEFTIELEEANILHVVSVDVCSTLCTNEDEQHLILNVNAWKYNNDTRLCSCLWIDFDKCNWQDYLTNTFSSAATIMVYLQLSKVVPCG